ncbi:hypothetical protein [Actinoplanes sp. N902-109]|uniref:hypothetical protein n=1 Tax=Actinoplanes sp. (strain N902-109) TaxID=649831 RepID=UPI0003294322|nr:hypothetical protein [Actinoplanes sp. N902-109]AGL14739.1 hypothetical protein L083_1229 [Actinoplanes sp. N902-109]
MSTLSTRPGTRLPTARDQARHALVLLGAPATPRLVVDVHSALFDGDLSVPALVEILRDEERQYDPDALMSYRIVPALHHDLSAARGLVTLCGWPVARRLVSPQQSRADALAAVARIAEFVIVRATASAAAMDLLRRLAETVPGGAEAFLVHDPRALATAARAALAELTPDPAPDAVVARWERLDARQRLFGVMSLPHQRGRA